MTKHPRHLHKLGLLLTLIGAVAGVGAAASCGGFGGEDDPSIEGQNQPLSCDMPRPGCPCSDEGIKVVCGESVGTQGGQVVCGRGTATCEKGVFSACQIDNSVSLAPGNKPLTQGNPVDCPDPCDPYCWTFNDDPSGETNLDAGIVEGNGGITLPGTDASTPPLNCSGGTSGTCAHTICEVGSSLTANCDDAAGGQPGPPVNQVIFHEEFADNSQGWTLGNEWEIGPATQSFGHSSGSGDPNNDSSPSSNDGVAGVDIGGNANTVTHGWYWLTSPVINMAGMSAPATLSYDRWLNSDWSPNWWENRVEVYDGSNWIMIWQGDPEDNSWNNESFDVSNFMNPAFRVRFGFRINSADWTMSAWNVDEVIVEAGVPNNPPPAGGSCVTQVCAADPTCCSTAWTQSCVNMVLTECGAVCQCDMDGFWVACFQDGFDHDGDGFSYLNGDCLDCDAQQNPGAYDFPANGIDEDCSGTIDDELPSCDTNLALASSNPYDYARAIDLCSIQPPADEWGVTYAALVQADASQSVHSLSKGIQSSFGAANTPYVGSHMAAFSSGTARKPGQTGYVNPSGQFASYNQGMSAAYPPGFPANAQGCPSGAGSAYDSTGLWMNIRVPTNAKSFTYNFHYFSSEYPEWVCTSYNDHFVALLDSNQHTGNISFDANGDPVSVNVAFFTVPGCSTCTSPILTGTGFDGWCGGQICGGSTDWLFTSAPVDPGETITMHFSTWDMGDHVWDSTVLIDAWTWSVNDANVETGQVPTPPPTTYSDGYFVRDYDATGICPQGQNIQWGLWSWQTGTPSDTYIDFFVRTADTVGQLGSAAEDAVLFTDPPGPGALNGTDAIAQASPVDTQTGAANVDEALMNAGFARNKPVVRIISHLAPSTDQLSAPTLLAWNLQFDCVENQ